MWLSNMHLHGVVQTFMARVLLLAKDLIEVKGYRSHFFVDNSTNIYVRMLRKQYTGVLVW